MEDFYILMSDYDEPIITRNFLYRKTISYRNPFPTYQSNLIVKLILDENNFNFGLAKEDGSDFRLLSGTATLKMWVAYWSVENKQAVLFFKLPSIGGGSLVYFEAYWGNADTEDISDPDSLGFLFYESFDSSPLDSNKWAGTINDTVNEYGYSLNSTADRVTIVNPLEGLNNWVIEAGIYCAWDNNTVWSSTIRSFKFSFEGTENNFDVQFMKDTRIYSNATNGTSNVAFTQDYGGLEELSYNGVYISYYEPNDKVTARLTDRNNFPDIEAYFQRKVEGDTRPQNIRIYGYNYGSGASYGPHPSYINWLVVREYDAVAISEIDGSNLYVPYERIDPDPQDERSFQDDFTSVIYRHESTFGGDPYLLSDNGYNSDTNVWISNDLTSGEDYVALTMHTGWKDNVVSRKYIHYDSGHTYLYNASKLSDSDTDHNGRNYWHCTLNYGWAAIKFSEPRCIGAISIKATDELDACPKDFVFYGSNYNPVIDFSKKIKLKEGTFEQKEGFQSRVVEHNSKYRYYILEVLNTYGDVDIQVQEWELMDSIQSRRVKTPSQLRLHPSLYDDWIYNFPKQICLQGSIDNINWETILPWRNTYTPFIEHYTGYGLWQRYSFYNANSYWSFRLLCRGNWEASDDRIIIGEWSMHELESESYTVRVLDGTTNFIQQIWASENCGINDRYKLFFVANDKINKISAKKLAGSKDLPTQYTDFNVVQEN
jgi:hypothetical protein